MDARTIIERIEKLRALMAEGGISAVIVPTGDYHMSEYCAPYFRTREYITGFDGSAGTAVITMDDAGLWTDSRYYIQAEQQLGGTGIDLYKMEPGVPSVTEFLKSHLKCGETVAFDGRIISCSTYEKWSSELLPAGIKVDAGRDPAGEIWEDRPALPCDPAFEYDIKYAGVSRAEKIALIRQDMEEQGADALFIASLSDIAWLLNLRGNDVHCNPVFLSYILVDQKQIRLFTQREAFSAELADKLAAESISIESYFGAAEALAALEDGTSLWLSSAGVSSSLKNAVNEGVRIIDLPEPTAMRKAVKNSVEQECARSAHVKDGVAVTKWIYWLTQNVGRMKISEISAAEKLHELRAEQDLFMGDSFDPIIAYGEHAAIVHYSASPETDAELEPHGLLLADTGGQYLDGTTDITRTFALGPLTEEERTMFTAVLRGHIDLAMAVFREGCNGQNLDILAHLALWSMCRDYGHGTGHGIGQFLNVHEGPNSIFWDTRRSKKASPAFCPGMITSDEPGYYEAGGFGIRHESLLLCREHCETEFGKFLSFDEITLVPFDLSAVIPEMLTYEEKDYLNRYHQTVFETISPLLEPGEAAWLREATRSIQ